MTPDILPMPLMRAAAVIVTGTAAYTAAQQAIGALAFERSLGVPVSPSVADDPKGCLPDASSRTGMDYALRQLRYALPSTHKLVGALSCSVVEALEGRPCT